MIENCGECYRRWYCYIDPRECDKLAHSVSVTNADRIRIMSDEELNDLFYEIYNAGVEDAVSYEWGQRTNSFEWTWNGFSSQQRRADNEAD